MSVKQTLTLVAKIVALAVVMVIAYAIGQPLLGRFPEAAAAEGPPGPEQAGSLLGLLFAFSLLQAAALSWALFRSRGHGWRLALAVFVALYGTTTVLSQMESVVYLGERIGAGLLGGLFLVGALVAAVFSPIAVAVMGRWRTVAGNVRPESSFATTAGGWAWKLTVLCLVYVVLYYTFGYFVAWKNPEVRAFYGGEDPGSFFAQMASVARGAPWMIPFQALRGGLWVLVVLPLLRTMRGRWWEAGAVVAALYTAPSIMLLFPNPLMPDAVRMAHLVETAPYQFLFGWLTVWLLHLGPRPTSRQELAEATSLSAG